MLGFFFKVLGIDLVYIEDVEDYLFMIRVMLEFFIIVFIDWKFLDVFIFYLL